MISEIDLRDWNYDQLRTSISTLRSTCLPVEDVVTADDYLREFIDHIETLSKSNRKQVAALFKPRKYADKEHQN